MIFSFENQRSSPATGTDRSGNPGAQMERRLEISGLFLLVGDLDVGWIPGRLNDPDGNFPAARVIGIGGFSSFDGQIHRPACEGGGSFVR